MNEVELLLQITTVCFEVTCWVYLDRNSNYIRTMIKILNTYLSVRIHTY